MSLSVRSPAPGVNGRLLPEQVLRQALAQVSFYLFAVSKIFKIAQPHQLVSFGTTPIPGRICEQPYTTIGVDIDGNVALCACSDWMPSTVGNIFQNTLEEILGNSLSQEIRRSMRDSSFDYCNAKTCGSINNNLLTEISTLEPAAQKFLQDTAKFVLPNRIWLAGDKTCNLSCPSCRTQIIKNSPQEAEQYAALGQTIYQNLFSKPTDQTITIHTSTSGEVFASPLILGFINSIDPVAFPNVKLALQTNGVLIKKRWDRLGAMADRVTAVTITTDATRPDTYTKLRRGGDWRELQESLDWISNKKKSQSIWLSMRMVVQYDNFDQIEEFYHQAISLGADTVEYCRLQNWGTYSKSEFLHHDVFSPNHPQYQQARQQLGRVQQFQSVRVFGDLTLPAGLTSVTV